MGGQTRLSIPGESVKEVIVELETRFPGISGRLCVDGRLRPGMAVFTRYANVLDAQGNPMTVREALALPGDPEA